MRDCASCANCSSDHRGFGDFFRCIASLPGLRGVDVDAVRTLRRHRNSHGNQFLGLAGKLSVGKRRFVEFNESVPCVGHDGSFRPISRPLSRDQSMHSQYELWPKYENLHQFPMWGAITEYTIWQSIGPTIWFTAELPARNRPWSISCPERLRGDRQRAFRTSIV